MTEVNSRVSVRVCVLQAPMRAAAGAALSSHKFSATRPPCRLRTKFGTCMSHVISWCASTRAIFLPHGAGCAFCRFRAHERHQHRNAARVGAAQRSSLLPAYIGRRAYGLAHFHRHRRLLRCDFTHHSVRGSVLVSIACKAGRGVRGVAKPQVTHACG